MTKETVDNTNERASSQENSKSETVTRRGMLSKSGLMAAGVATAPLWLPKGIAYANPGVGQHTLVVMFMRGGCDGLSILAPRFVLPPGPDTFYSAQRQTPSGGPQLAIPQPGVGNGVTPLMGPGSVNLPWMLSEGAAAAHLMYQAGNLAFVQGVGFPVSNNGSHFFSQDFMEDGTQLSVQSSDGQGWAGRGMQAIISTQPWRGMGYGKILQRTLFGAPSTIAIPDPANYDLNGLPTSTLLRKLAHQFSFNVSDEPLKSAAAGSLETIEKINDPAIFAKPSTATYPPSFFGGQMKKVQQLIQASADPAINVCLETVMLDYGDWDNHSQMGPTPNTVADPSQEGMHNRMKDVFESMQAFYTDLQTHAPSANYTFVFMTEFGRRITANGNAGVDHGRGSLMAIMGSNGVRGGDVYTMIPNPPLDGTVPGWGGLAAHSVLQGGSTTTYNLAASIDYRRVLGEILEKRMGLTPTEVRSSFPGYDYGLASDKMPIGALI